MARIPRLLSFFDRLCFLGSTFGYFPERSKSILIVPPTRVSHAKSAAATHGFQVTKGSRYIVGFIGKPSTQTAWLTAKVNKWTKGVAQLIKLTVTHPQ